MCRGSFLTKIKKEPLLKVKRRCGLVVRLKSIKSIKELLCSLSSHINLQSFNFCSPRPIGIMMIGVFVLMVYCLMRWAWLSLLLLSIWLSLFWSIPKAIRFTHELHARIIGMAIKTCYHFHKSDFHKSDLSLSQFTSFMNCTLGFTIYLGPNAVMTFRPSSHKSRFICHIRIATLSRRIVLQ